MTLSSSGSLQNELATHVTLISSQTAVLQAWWCMMLPSAAKGILLFNQPVGWGGKEDASDEPGNTFTEKWMKQQKLHFSDYLMQRNVHKLSGNCAFGGQECIHATGCPIA
ncbi:unnamed protein product [Effrenium voratum]|nr:unnamed protein product [Effrenium voratum]